MGQIVSLLMGAMVVLTATVSVLSFPSSNEINHSPIVIDGDDALKKLAQSEKWQGDGSEETPYIIEGYIIDARNSSAIYIGNTTLSFIIRNCRLKSESARESSAIFLYNVSNAKIENTTCNFSDKGIERMSAVGMFYTPSNSEDIRRLWEGNEGYLKACTIALGMSGAQDDIDSWIRGLNLVKKITNGGLKIVVDVPWYGCQTYVQSIVPPSGYKKDLYDVEINESAVENWVKKFLNDVKMEHLDDIIAGWYVADEPFGKFKDVEAVNDVISSIRRAERYFGKNHDIYVAYCLGSLTWYASDGYNYNGNWIKEERRAKFFNETQIMVDWYGGPDEWRDYLNDYKIMNYIEGDGENFHAIIPAGMNCGKYITRSEIWEYIDTIRCQLPMTTIWFWSWSFGTDSSGNVVRDGASSHWDGSKEDDIAAVAEALSEISIGGIVLNRCKNVEIINTNMTSLYIYRSQRCKITGCNIENSADEQMRITWSENIEISNCVLRNASKSSSLYYSKKCAMKSNEISKNDEYGIYFYASSDSIIKNNRILNCSDYAIRLEYHSLRNKIYRNSFFWNNGAKEEYSKQHVQAYDSSYNIWSEGGSGNFWCDWRAPDEDGDEITDIPYAIDGKTSWDSHPLVYSPHPFIPSEPKLLKIDAGDKFVHIYWEKPEYDGFGRILKYKIYRGENFRNLKVIADVNESFDNYNDTDVMNGIEYYYAITALNIAGESVISITLSATPSAPPSPPENLSVTYGKSYVFLRWKEPIYCGGMEISHYKVYRGTDKNLMKSIIRTNTTEYNDTSVMNGITYYYYVTAVNPAGESKASLIIFVTPGSVPSPPQKLDADDGYGKIIIFWNEPADDGGFPVESYRIYRGESIERYSFYDEVSSSTLQYEDIWVECGKSYFYSITAVNRMGESRMSEWISMETFELPGKPRNVQAEAHDTYVMIRWMKPENDGGKILKYNIYRRSGLNYILISSTEPWNLIYNDTSVKNGKIYYYKISAISPAGEGEMSMEVLAMPMPTDRVRPMIVIEKPKDNTITSNETVEIRGRAWDDSYIEYVEISIDGKNWTMCDGRENWSVVVHLRNGRNVIYVRAVDSSGKSSITTINVTLLKDDTSKDDKGSNYYDSFVALFILLILIISIIVILFRVPKLIRTLFRK